MSRERHIRVERRLLLGNHWLKLLPLSRHHDNHLHELSHNRRPQQEHGAAWKTNWENSGGANRREETTNLPESLALEFILAERCLGQREGSWVRPNMGQERWLARDNPEINLITIGSLILFFSAQAPLNGIFCFCQHRCLLRKIQFWMLDKSPLPGPGRGPPFYSTTLKRNSFLSYFS